MTYPALDLLFPKPVTGSPIAHIRVGTSMQMGSAYPGHENDILLTGSCATFRTLKGVIERLHRELDDIKAEARRKFDQAQI